MTTNAANSPMARGRLSATSVAELLVFALERRLSGSFVFETPVSDKSALVVASGRVTKVRTAAPVEPLGRVLTDCGVIDDAALELGLRLAHEHNDRLGDTLVRLDKVRPAALDAALREQLGRRLSWLEQLPRESAYGFYPDVDFLEDRPSCGADPLALIWRCVRDVHALSPRQEAVLATLGQRALSLRPRAALDRVELNAEERAWIENVRARPLALDALLAVGGMQPAAARRLVYALLLMRQLEVLGDRLSSAPPAPAPASTPPPAVVRPSAAPVSARPSVAPPACPPVPRGSSTRPPGDRVEHALERASRLVRERARAEGSLAAALALQEAREHIERKHYAAAEPLVRKACEADPSNAEVMALHAWLRAQTGELTTPAFAAQVMAALDRAAMKAPENVSVRLYRAQVLKRLGRDDEAFKDFRFVARRAPEQLDAVREVRLHTMRTRNKEKQSGVFSKLFLR